MKKIAAFAAFFALILLLTKIANQAPKEQMQGISFSLKAQRVVQCSAGEITLVDTHQNATHLYKDESWPDCSTYQSGEVLDFFLSRGEKTHYLSSEKSSWWRKAM